MQAAAIPDNEGERLAALRALLILDTPPEQRFDRIVEFAAEQLEMPIVLLSLVDANRQWFKSRVGLDACETDRRSSFCAHAIHSDEVLIVPDTLHDPRFSDNPLVTGAPFIRFYAGAPLQTQPGLRVGTLCLIDSRPRSLDATDLAILRSLCELARSELLGQHLEP
jgi:GAF domain-containing protein